MRLAISLRRGDTSSTVRLSGEDDADHGTILVKSERKNEPQRHRDTEKTRRKVIVRQTKRFLCRFSLCLCGSFFPFALRTTRSRPVLVGRARNRGQTPTRPNPKKTENI